MVIRLKPLPDEIVLSYLGRLMRVNGLKGEREALQFMSRAVVLSQVNQRMRPTVQILSAMAGMDVALFVRQHTLVPLRRGITSYLEEVEHGGAGCEGVVRHTGVRKLRNGLYACPACVKTDIMNLGPDGQVKLPHLWPPKLLQAGRGNYAGSEVVTRRAEASFRR